MEILKNINELKKSFEEINKLIDELISNLEFEQLKSKNREKDIEYLKNEVRANVEKIDEIIADYNANL